MVEKAVLTTSSAITLSMDAADALIGLRDGNAALLYIYILRNGGIFDPNKAASELSLPPEAVRNAAMALERRRLIASGSPFGAVSETPPEYTVEDVKTRLSETPEFMGIVQETQRRLGKALSGADLVMLFGIYDYLGMPYEVILLLLTHCIEEFRRRYGEGRVPTIRYIEKEAYVWARLEILTQERAEEHLRRRIENQSRTEEIKKLLRIKKRELSPSEEKYIASWLDMSFEPEAIELAYDKTVVKTGELSWAYMNSILKSWHSKGLRTVSEIDTKDSRKASANNQKPRDSVPTYEEADRVRRYLDSIKE